MTRKSTCNHRLFVVKCQKKAIAGDEMMAYRVFISFKYTTMDGKGVTRDYAIARDLHSALKRAGVKAFLSEEELSKGDFIKEINKMLEETDIMIVVGTKPEHIQSKWVEDEWSSFLALINGGLKPKGDIYTYLEGMSPNALPPVLYKRQSYTTDERDKLIGRITAQLGIKPPSPRKTIPQKPKRPRTASPSAAPVYAQVGNILQFGQYPQGANGEVRPLSWRVLDVRNGMALLITEKLIDCVKYNETKTDVTWETTTLRKWMNSDFINKAFSNDQQTQIITFNNSNPNNPRKHTIGGNATQDKLFALTINDANKYFLDENDRMAAVTEYAVKQGCYVSNSYSLPNGDKPGWWWLRSPGENSIHAARVLDNGEIGLYGYFVNHGSGSVRPAFWLKLS